LAKKPKINYREIKYKHNPKESYYLDLKPMMKRGKFLNFCVSSRRMGKTFSTTLIALDEWFKKGRNTLWLRRYDPQITKELNRANQWWPEIVEFYCKKYGREYIEAKRDKNILYIDGEPVIYYETLASAVSQKGHSISGISLIVFDEFIEKQRWRYISPAEEEPTEYFLKTWSTIFRDDNIPVNERKVICIANAESLANPYFNEFQLVDKIQPDTEWLISDEDDICYYMPRMSKALKEKLMGDPVYRIISKTSYAAVAIDNTFFDGGQLNIKEKLLPSSKQLFSIQIYGTNYFVYEQRENKNTEYIYVSTQGTFGKYRYVLDIGSIQDEKEIVIKSEVLTYMREALRNNIVRYADVKTRSIFTDAVKGR